MYNSSSAVQSMRPFDTEGVRGICSSVLASLRGGKNAIPKSFSVGLVVEAASLMVMFLVFSSFVNLIALVRKLMICRKILVECSTTDSEDHILAHHLQETTWIYQDIIKGQISKALIDVDIRRDFSMLNLHFKHFQCRLDD